jgi:hypothetical protein
MKFITSIILKIVKFSKKEEKKILGRWNIDYCDRMNRKIDLSNEDHCGTCVGDFTKNIKNDYEDEYYAPYISENVCDIDKKYRVKQ